MVSLDKNHYLIYFADNHKWWISVESDTNDLHVWTFDKELNFDFKININDDLVSCILELKSLLVIGSLNFSIKLFNIKSKSIISTLQTNSPVMRISINLELAQILSIGTIPNIKVWTSDSSFHRPLIGELEGHKEIVVDA